jgi:outer membrane lipoprotein-sorting protein
MKQISLLFLFLLFIPFTFSQEKASDVLKALQNKFDSINDLEANISQSTDGKQNLIGKLLYKKDNKLRFELKNHLIISNGTTSWNYTKKENKVIISSVDDETEGIFSVKKLVYEYPSECDLSLEEEAGQKVLTLIPSSTSLSFNYLKLYINKENLISQVLLSEGAGSLSLVNISDYVLNKNIPDSKFSFTSPEGCKVIDLR